jgi:hypothetical protein
VSLESICSIRVVFIFVFWKGLVKMSEDFYRWVVGKGELADRTERGQKYQDTMSGLAKHLGGAYVPGEFEGHLEGLAKTANRDLVLDLFYVAPFIMANSNSVESHDGWEMFVDESISKGRVSTMKGLVKLLGHPNLDRKKYALGFYSKVLERVGNLWGFEREDVFVSNFLGDVYKALDVDRLTQKKAMGALQGVFERYLSL